MKCKYCGKDIPVNFKYRVYCSRECSSAFYNRKGKQNTECIICGKPLPPLRRSYCSDECARRSKICREEEYNKEQYKKPKAEEQKKPKKRGRPKKNSTLAGINELARAEGLSYGQYVGKYGL
jgi:predicted nucleic acid-binding Zn ribbon protein